MQPHDPGNSRSSFKSHNPLVPLILQLLREQPDGCSEYELLKRVENDGDHFSALSDDSQLALFQKHFLVMNALYRLQQLLWDDEHLWLQISPLRIALSAIESIGEEKNIAPSGGHALCNYYLDWNNFASADSDSVAALLGNFWQRFYAQDEQGNALKILELDTGADWLTIKQQYRRLAARAHPDRGGDNAQFLAIREAYEILRVWRCPLPLSSQKREE